MQHYCDKNMFQYIQMCQWSNGNWDSTFAVDIIMFLNSDQTSKIFKFTSWWYVILITFLKFHVFSLKIYFGRMQQFVIWHQDDTSHVLQKLSYPLKIFVEEKHIFWEKIVTCHKIHLTHRPYYPDALRRSNDYFKSFYLCTIS